MTTNPQHTEAFGGDGWDGELLPAGALLTGSEEYYPTVAINALMRSLRDAALSSQHFEVSRASHHSGIASVPLLYCCLAVLVSASADMLHILH